METIGPIAIFVGLLVLVAITWWVRQREQVPVSRNTERMLRGKREDSHSAVVTATEYGQIIHVNEMARSWLDTGTAPIDLELLSVQTQPRENLLQLFMQEGQASFQLGARWVEATSHFVPTADGHQVVLIMREMSSASTSGVAGVDISRAMQIVNEIGETVQANLGVDRGLQTLLDILRQSFNAEAAEICLWNEQTQRLDQRGWVGDARYLLAIAEAGGGYALGDGVAGWVAQHDEPLLILGEGDPVNLLNLVADHPYRSALAMPLMQAERLLGTLALFHSTPRTFDRPQVTLLQAIARPLAMTIHNLELYEQQQNRIRDIASLQEIAEQPKSGESALQVFRLMNERIAKLIDAEMCGVLLFDAESHALLPQIPFYGLPDNVAQLVTVPLPDGSPQREIWERQPSWVSNDVREEPLIDATNLRSLVEVAGIRNVALLPMLVGGQRFGMVLVANRRARAGFNLQDMQNLTVLATQAAIVVENMRLYQQERRIDSELAGLQEMTAAIGALSQEGEFFAEISERIARLMRSQMCGILLYDASAQHLVAQPPFYGVPFELASQYRVPLTSGSVMAELWQEEDSWLSNRVSTDALVYAAGLDAIAEAIGVHKTLMAVMAAGGRRIGVVQVSNKLDASDYTPSDARLLRIFATQASAIIENARLYREVQVRANQSEQLRRIAELAIGILSSEESFEPVLAEIARFMDSQLVYINVIDSTTNTLISYPRWAYGFTLAEPVVQDMTAPGYEYSVALSGQPFLSNDLANDRRVLPGYRLVVDRYKMRSVVVVPLVVGDRKLGELGVGNRPRGYTNEDVSALGAVAVQIAAAMERLLLFEATGENLRRRVEELDAIARVSNVLTATIDLDSILNAIRDEAEKATHADGSTVVLLRPNQDWAAADLPEMERRVGQEDLLPMLATIEIEAVQRGAESVLVTDYEASALEAQPQGTRSAAAAAILYVDQIVGVLHVFHHNPNHFDERAAGFMMTLAAKASLGYQNALVYQQQMERGERLRQRAEQLNRIFELGQMVQSNTDPVSVLEAIAYSVQQSVGFDTVLMLLVDEDAHLLRRAAQAGMPIDVFEALRDLTLSLDELDQVFRPEYQESDTFFLPAEKLEAWYTPGMKVLSPAFDERRSLQATGRSSWHDGDMLLVQLIGHGGNLLGVMSLDRPYNNRRPDRATVEVLEIFAHQAAAMVENTRLFLESRRSAEQEARLNEMMETIASTLEIDEIAISIAQGVQRLLPFSGLEVALIDTSDEGFDYLRIKPAGPDDFVIEREQLPDLEGLALGRAFTERHDTLYQSGDPAIPAYRDLAAAFAAGQHAGLLLPLLTGGDCVGALHIGSRDMQALLPADIRAMLLRMAQLIASTIQNARLFNQAVNLQILNRSVVESIQQGIVVLDQAGQVININEFMRQVYGWDSTALHKHLFSYQPDLAEFLGDDLDAVLSQGQPRERLRLTTRSLDGAIRVRNFYIYPLRSGDLVRGAVVLVEDVTERTELEEAIEQRANQLAALTEVSTRITASLERSEVVRIALDEMGWVIPFDTMTIWRRTGAYMVLEGSSGFSEDLMHAAEPLRVRIADDERVQQLVETQRGFTLPDVAGMAIDTLPGDREARSWMGVPLVNQGQVVGMIVLGKREAQHYETRAEQHVAFAYASQVAIAIANADLFEQTFERTSELGTLLEASQATSLTRDVNQVFRTVAELMFTALEMDTCAIAIWDEVDNELEVQFSVNRRGDRSEGGAIFNLGQYPARLYALRQREVVVIIDRGDSPDVPDVPYPGEVEELRQLGYGARMLVPLVVRDQSVGLIQLEQVSSDERTLTQQRVRLARALGSQMAITIENARLATETTARFEELLTINTLSQALMSSLRLEDILPIIREQVPAVTGAEELYLALYDAENELVSFPLAVSHGQPIEIEPRSLGKDEVSYIIRRRQPLSLGADYFSIDELRRSLGITTSEGDVRSYMGVPLISGEQVLGVLAIRSRERTRAFNVNDERILTTVASQIAATIQNVRLFDQVTSFAQELNQIVEARTIELEEERDRLDTLYQITSELARTLDMDHLLERALSMVGKAVGAVDGVIMFTDPATDKLYCRAWLTSDNLQYHKDSSVPTHPAESLAQWLIQNEDVESRVMIVDDLHAEPYWNPDAPGAARLRSALAVMLESNEVPMGVMVFLGERSTMFTENHLKLLVPAANQVAAAINSADLYQLIRDQAERLGRMLRSEQEAAQKNSAILESITDGVMLADSSGTIVLFNTASERILQLPRDQAVGQPITRLAGMYGSSAVRWTQIIQEWTQSLERPEMSREFLAERVEIGDKVISVQLSPVYSGDLFLGTVSVFRDITKDVEADRLKSEFIESVSHEFRTPLTPIKGFTDLLLMGAAGTLSDMQSNMITTIKDNVERLTVLVNDVLNIAKLDRGDVTTTMQLVDLHELLPIVVQQITQREANLAKNMHVEVNVPQELPEIRADRDKLIQILANITDNAFNYTPAGGSVIITAQAEDDQKHVLISVADTGVGIPDHFKERVWRRFERYDEHALMLDVAGTGLGLTLVRELVTLHHGKVWFESQEGQGTTFYVQLPIEQPSYQTDTVEAVSIDSERMAGD